MKNILKRALPLMMAAALCISLFAGCAGGDSGKKVLKVGTSADYAPYEFHYVDGAKDEIVGFEMDIIRWLGEQMGYDEVQIVDTDFNGLLAAVEAGTVDCAIAALSVDEERLQSADFTDYYYIGTQSLLIRTADKDKYTSFESLSGQKVGVQNGTIHEQMSKDNIPDVQISAYTSVPDMILELKAGNVEALALDGYVAAGYAKMYSELLVPEISFGEANPEDSYAIAVKKGNTALIDEFNKAIAELAKTDKVAEWAAAANELMLQIQE